MVDPRFRVRLLLLLLFGSGAWLLWRESGELSSRVAAARAGRDAALRAGLAERERVEAEQRFARLAEALAARETPPTSPAGLRDGLLAAARSSGVDLASSRVQPLLRPPDGTRGAEARLTAEGDGASLRRFLNAVEGRGWPLRADRVQLALRSAERGVLSATFTVLWPDPATTITESGAARLAADPRIDRLVDWLAARPDAVPSGGSPGALQEGGETPDPVLLAGDADPPGRGSPGAAPPVADFASRLPRLHGFVEVGPGDPVRAALSYRGMLNLVAVGERLGEYVVVELTPSDAVVLAHPDEPPLRLTLR